MVELDILPDCTPLHLAVMHSAFALKPKEKRSERTGPNFLLNVGSAPSVVVGMCFFLF